MKEQVLPLSETMKQFFKSNAYVSLCKKVKSESGKFTVNWEEAEQVCLTNLVKFSAEEISRNIK